MILFEQTLTLSEREELIWLLKLEHKEIESKLSPAELLRMKELVMMKFNGAQLEPEEVKELEELHKKQNEGIGGLTPGQLTILYSLQDYQKKGNKIDNLKILRAQDLLLKLQALPSQLNIEQEAELEYLE